MMNKRNGFAVNVFGTCLVAGFVFASSFANAACPNIDHAVSNLQKAKQELMNAKHDFDGHRKDALDAIDKALEQLGLAMQSQQCK